MKNLIISIAELKGQAYMGHDIIDSDGLNLTWQELEKAKDIAVSILFTRRESRNLFQIISHKRATIIK